MYLSTIFSSPTPSFVPERDISDLTGSTILITGGNSGIGYHTAKELLLKGANVYITARSRDKGAQAIEQLERETKRTAKFLELELTDLRSVRRAVKEFLGKESLLDVLVNNAGIMEPPTKLLTTQNIDLQFGTNVLGPFFLTQLLIPALLASTKSRKSGFPARIINVSSSGHLNAPGEGIEFTSLRGGEERDACMARLYGQSKLANIILSNHFASKYGEDLGLVSTALHPGGIRTELRRYGSGITHAIKDKLLYPPSMGALTQLWAATVAPPDEVNGQYLIPWAQVAPPDSRILDARSGNATLSRELITWLEGEVEGF
ncbi:NAD(P)-binding protein [Mycena capillaripes]|nr:NAD(P)-binding protein [Mycena capillaripes]